MTRFRCLKVKVTRPLTLWPKISHIFVTGRPMNFILGTRMEYDDPHHRHTRSRTYHKLCARPPQYAPAPCNGSAQRQPWARPAPGAQDGQNLISWRWSLPSPTDQVCWRSMHTISNYRVNRRTNKQTNTHKQTAPITIHCAAKLSAQY